MSNAIPFPKRYLSHALSVSLLSLAVPHAAFAQ